MDEQTHCLQQDKERPRQHIIAGSLPAPHFPQISAVTLCMLPDRTQAGMSKRNS